MSKKPMFVLHAFTCMKISVMATMDIPTGTRLPLFKKGDYKLRSKKQMDKMPMSEVLMQYCIEDEDGVHGPKDFEQMSIGWYITHSEVPNAVVDEKYNYFACRNIKKGDIVTVDYRTFGDHRYPPA